MAQPPEGQKNVSSIKEAVPRSQGDSEEDACIAEFVENPLRKALINDLCDDHVQLFEEVISIRRYLLRFANRIVEATARNTSYETVVFLELEYQMLAVLSLLPKHKHTTRSLYGGMRDLVMTMLVHRRQELMRPVTEQLCVADEAENKRKATEEKDGDGEPSKEVKAETTAVNGKDKE